MNRLRKDRMHGRRTDGQTNALTHARSPCGELEMEEEKGNIERLVFCHLIYSYTNWRGEIFSFGGEKIKKDENERGARARCAHSWPGCAAVRRESLLLSILSVALCRWWSPGGCVDPATERRGARKIRNAEVRSAGRERDGTKPRAIILIF